MSEREVLKIPVVVIDDEPDTLDLIEAALQNDEIKILTTTDPKQGLEMIAREQAAIALVDLKMPAMDGLEVLERILAADPAVEVILMTGFYSTESAVEAVQKGAADYLTKPISLDKLRQRLQKLIDEKHLRRRSLQLERELLDTFRFEEMIGRSPIMLEVFSRIRRIAPHFRTVLVTGDTGTGKELVARALHRLSPYSSGPFLVSNCAAIVETLFESELFGHVRGAFTGATQDKMGLFELANGGTVFLDEIGEMPQAMQAKLLRILQDHEIQRVGSPVPRKLDVRVIAASNRDLRTLVAEKKFREDLYYRLSMVEVRLPRLAERKEDLPLLQKYFVERFSRQYQKPIVGISRRAQSVMARYSWPGNVRELENVLGNACMMVDGTFIDVKDLPAQLQSPLPETAEGQELVSLEEIKRRHILYVLKSVGGDKTRAAEILGIGRATLYNFLGSFQQESKEPAG